LLYIVGRYIVGRMVKASSSMSEPSYFILAALLDDPLHGYGIIKKAAELSNGRIQLAAGTLYGALDRLAEEGLLLADREEVVEGRTRRYYRLTDRGSHALHREAARMEQAARIVTRRSGLAATNPNLA
jgi:DNA-binding PadR family transcriptional regulator